MPYGITLCYVPPGRGDIPAFTPANAGTHKNVGTQIRNGGTHNILEMLPKD